MKKTRYAILKIEVDDDKAGKLTMYSGNNERVWFFDKSVTFSPKELKRLWQNLLETI